MGKDISVFFFFVPISLLAMLTVSGDLASGLFSTASGLVAREVEATDGETLMMAEFLGS